MSGFAKIFAELRKKKEGAFIPFVVLGDPDEKTSLKIIKTLISSGADALELGFAFSDPIADGKTVQEAGQRALAKGMNTDRCFSLIKKIRDFNEEIPVSLLIYYNLILQRGIGKFYSDAKSAGADAILAADCPVEETGSLLLAAREHGINQVFIVSPTTAKERMRKILRKCSGYVYLVSVLGVTGARSGLHKRTIGLVKSARRATRLPLCVGFGISKPEHARQVIAAGADGVIVGSAVINIIRENLCGEEKMLAEIKKFSAEMKRATARQASFQELRQA